MDYANIAAVIFASLSEEEENKEAFADALQKASSIVTGRHEDWAAGAVADIKKFAAHSNRRAQETGGARATAEGIFERVRDGPRVRVGDGASVFQAPDPRYSPPPETLQPLHHSAQAGGSPLATQIHASLSTEEENRGSFTDAMQKASSTVNAGHSEWRAEADAEMRAFAAQSKRRAHETDSARATAQGILERVRDGPLMPQKDGASVSKAPSDKEDPPPENPQPAQHSTQAGDSPEAMLAPRSSFSIATVIYKMAMLSPYLTCAAGVIVVLMIVISSVLALSKAMTHV